MKRALSLWYAIGAFFTTSCIAAGLPSVTDEKASNGDYIGMGTSASGKTIALVVQVVGAVMLIGVAWMGISTLMDVHNGKKTWADVGKQGFAGVCLLFIGFVLLTQANSIFS